MLKRISLLEITRNPDQPRQHFDLRKLEELALSIAENGLQQPITVRPIDPDGEGHKYQVVMGERRFRAHMLLAERSELADVLCHVRKMDDRDTHINAILENLQRVDVSAIEEAYAYHHAMEEFGFTATELAKKLGINSAWLIPNRVKLLKLTEDNQDLLSKGIISKKQAHNMADLSPNGQTEFLKLVKQGLCSTNRSCELAAERIAASEAQTTMDVGEAPKERRDCTSAKTVEAKLDQMGKLLQPFFTEKGLTICDDLDPATAKRSLEKVKLLRLHLNHIERELQLAATMSELSVH
jgi:ParB family chromosome partitioning protein